MNNRAEEVEIYTWWRIKMKPCNEEAEQAWGERASTGICQLQLTQSSCTLTRTASSHDKLHQKEEAEEGREEGGEEGGTAQRALSLPWTDTHLTHTTAQGPSLRSNALSWLPEPRCVLVKKKQQTNQLTNKQTDKKKNDTHFGSHWPIKKKKKNRNET